ncbi:MAG TPA: protein kinase [Polyangiaceae bacterium]|nr:protein kinase [Polyangiaceae bacterium]
MAVELGQVLDGKYRIVRLIGAGGMGAVYEATHLLIDRRVAVKELHATAAAADHAITRFEREARAAGRIGSDHILQIFDVGVLPDGSRYMVSEFLEGETLDARLRRVGRLSAAELFPIAQQLLSGLADAHRALVLHRDLKPDNIFLVRQKSGVADFVKIIDFGIAKFQVGLDQEDALKMTKTGMVVGTPYYLSPEQARGTGEADARSDLYAVGVILYECITGEVPFHAENFNELIFKIVLETPQPPVERAPGIDQRLSDLILKAMARDPALRFQTAQEMMAALQAWASGENPATVNLGARSLTPPNGQTLLSAQDRPSGAPRGAGATPAVAFRARPTPTPASFGATRDPSPSSYAVPQRSNLLLFLVLGGFGLLSLVAGILIFRHARSEEPASAASAVQPQPSSVANTPRVEPAVTEPPASGELVAPLDPLSNSEPPSESEAPRVPAPSKVRVTGRGQVQKRAVVVAPTPTPTPTPTSTPAPAAHPAPTVAEPDPPAKKRSNWGY